MKIAELFAEIGFDIKGKEDLAAVDKALGLIESGAIRLLVGVSAVNAAFYTMLYTAGQAGTALEKFAVSTGLSSEELQKWQRAGRMAGVSANEITSAIYAIQDAQMKIRTGQGGDTAPFNIFGIGTAEDPYVVLQKLSTNIRQYQPAFARMMLQRMGLGPDMYQFLMRLTPAMSEVNRQFVVTNAEQKRLFEFNASWQRFVFTISTLKDRFASTLTPAVGRFLDVLSATGEKLGEFVEWLEKGTPAANATRIALLGVAAAFTAIGLVLPAIILGVTILTSEITVLMIELSPIIVVLGLMAAAIIAVILLIQDFMVAAEGGESFSKWDKGILLTVDNVNALAHAIEYLIDTWDKLTEGTKAGLFAGIASSFPGMGALSFAASLLPWLSKQDQPTTQSQQNNVNIHVHGAGDPKTTGQEAYRAAHQEIVNRAFFQNPVPAK